MWTALKQKNKKQKQTKKQPNNPTRPNPTRPERGVASCTSWRRRFAAELWFCSKVSKENCCSLASQDGRWLDSFLAWALVVFGLFWLFFLGLLGCFLIAFCGVFAKMRRVDRFFCMFFVFWPATTNITTCGCGTKLRIWVNSQRKPLAVGWSCPSPSKKPKKIH